MNSYMMKKYQIVPIKYQNALYSYKIILTEPFPTKVKFVTISI